MNRKKNTTMIKKDESFRYVTSIGCGICGQRLMTACSIANAERLILNGWCSIGSRLVCPECSKDWDQIHRKKLSSEAHTEGLLVMYMYSDKEASACFQKN